MIWYLGETKYFYVTVSSSSGSSFTISSAIYTIYNQSDDSLVTSGTGTVSDSTIYALWTPTATGVFVAVITYVINLETFTSSQTIRVKETM